MKLWAKITIGLVAGVATGLLLGERATVLKPLGDMFINAIKMLIVPLVFSSLVVGVASLNDPKKLGRVGLKSFVLYLLTTVVAICIGLGVGYMIKPGAGMNLIPSSEVAVVKQQSLVDTIVALVPANPIMAIVNADILPMIVFAVFFGVALVLVGEKAKPVSAVLEGVAEAMYKLTDIVMSAAPYGVFALIAWVSGSYGLAVLIPLAKVIFGVYAACALHAFGVYGMMLAVLGRLNPIRFLVGSRKSWRFRFPPLVVPLRCP